MDECSSRRKRKQKCETEMKISVKLEIFEGPLDLLLHLIEKNKVSIYDIPIVEITNQYMEYVNAMEKKNLDVVSDFLVIAATLIDIKSKMLLPKEVDEEGEEIDPRAELVARLVEYKMYKTIAYELKDKQIDADKSLFKEPTIPNEVAKYEEPVDLNQLLDGITLAKLKSIFQSVLKKQIDKIDPIRSKFGNIKKEKVRLSEKLIYIFEYSKKRKSFSFLNLLEEQNTKEDVIVTFLACLEMIKIGRLFISQKETFGDILLEWNEDCETTITKEAMEQYD